MAKSVREIRSAGSDKGGKESLQLQACPVGTLPVPGWECFFGHHDTDFYPLCFYIWIVRGNGQTGLIDTGLPLEEPDRRRLIDGCQAVDPRCTFSDIVTIDSLLTAHNLKPESIDFVLLTQTVTYHTGGLLPQFLPRAQVYMARAGLMEFLLENPGHPPRDLYFTGASWIFLRQLLIEDRLHLVEGAVEVLPNLLFEATGGHHPGSAGVQIKTSLGTVGILENAFLQRNIDEELPIGISENAALCREVIRRYKKECGLALAGHEPDILKRFANGLIE